MPYPAFKPGDVVLVYGKGKLPFWSGLLQRTIFKRKNPDGPSFSHVAVILNDKLAYEASPHGFPLATYIAEVMDKISPPTDAPPGAGDVDRLQARYRHTADTADRSLR